MKTKTTILILCLLLMQQSERLIAQGWTQKQFYPSTLGCDGGICFSINDKIYAGGGLGSRLFKEYDPSNDQWTSKAIIPGVSDRAFAISFSMNGKGYVGLGIDGSTAKKDLWEYDPATNVWTQKQNFPGQASDGLFCFVINNIAYLGAGEDPFSLQQYTACYSYDPASDSWATIADYPTSGIIYPFSFSLNNKGYVSCGQTNLGTTNLTFEYDPLLDVWTSRAPFTGADRQAGVSLVLSNTAYCGLGMSAGFYNDFYKYDYATDSWTYADSLPSNRRSFPIAAVANNTAYLGLGWSFDTAQHYYRDWWEYALSTGVNSLNNIKESAIYPNPFSDYLGILSGTNIFDKYEITDITGKIVLFGDLKSGKGNLDVSVLGSGTYLLNLVGDKIIESKLIVKE